MPTLAWLDILLASHGIPLGRFARVASAKNDTTSEQITYGYDTNLQLATESFAYNIYTKLLTRKYEISTDPVPGRFKGVQVGVSGTPNADYEAYYSYDATGRLNYAIGPGLPSHGANYTFTTNSDLVGQIDFKNGSSSIIASTVRAFETKRDLITNVENKWVATGGAPTVISNYAYRNDAVGRRKDVVTTGSAIGSDKLTLFTYNDRHELTSSKRYSGNNPDSPGAPISAQHYTFTYDPIGNP